MPDRGNFWDTLNSYLPYAAPATRLGSRLGRAAGSRMMGNTQSKMTGADILSYLMPAATAGMFTARKLQELGSPTPQTPAPSSASAVPGLGGFGMLANLAAMTLGSPPSASGQTMAMPSLSTTAPWASPGPIQPPPNAGYGTPTGRFLQGYGDPNAVPTPGYYQPAKMPYSGPGLEGARGPVPFQRNAPWQPNLNIPPLREPQPDANELRRQAMLAQAPPQLASAPERADLAGGMNLQQYATRAALEMTPEQLAGVHSGESGGLTPLQWSTLQQMGAPVGAWQGPMRSPGEIPGSTLENLRAMQTPEQAERFAAHRQGLRDTRAERRQARVDRAMGINPMGRTIMERMRGGGQGQEQNPGMDPMTAYMLGGPKMYETALNAQVAMRQAEGEGQRRKLEQASAEREGDLQLLGTLLAIPPAERGPEVKEDISQLRRKLGFGAQASSGGTTGPRTLDSIAAEHPTDPEAFKAEAKSLGYRDDEIDVAIDKLYPRRPWGRIGAALGSVFGPGVEQFFGLPGTTRSPYIMRAPR